MPIVVTCDDLAEADAVWRLISITGEPHSWEIRLAGSGHLCSVTPGPSSAALPVAPLGHSYPEADHAAP